MMTDKTQRVLDAIIDWRASHGYSPSVRDLMAPTGLHSPSAVDHHLQKLRREGRIEWQPATARSIVVMEERGRD